MINIDAVDLIVGFDSEFTRKDEKANIVVAYSVYVINPRKPELQAGLVFYPNGERKDQRRHWSRFLTECVIGAIESGIITAYPETMLVTGHYTRADIPGFRHFEINKKRFEACRGTYSSVNRTVPLGRKNDGLYFSKGNLKGISVWLTDTWLLTPAGYRSLEALGNLLGLEKLTPPDVIDENGNTVPGITRMDLVLAADREAFEAYAVRDAEISAKWCLEMMRLLRHLRIYEWPVTVSTAGGLLFKSMFEGTADRLEWRGWQQANQREGIEKGWWHEIARFIPFFSDCYFGGMNLCFTLGYSEPNRTVYDTDIAGAYTTAMSGIGWPLWGELRTTTDLDDLCTLDVLSFAKVDFEFPPHVRFPNLLVRLKESSIAYPLRGSTFATGPELIVARELGAKLTIREGVVVPTDATRLPMRQLSRAVADKRVEFKDTPLKEKLVKEMGNSVYGRIGQNVGAHRTNYPKQSRKFDPKTGEYDLMDDSSITQPAIAAMITGFVRALAAEQINAVPADEIVHSVTTDGWLATVDKSNCTSGPITDWFKSIRPHIADSDILEEKHRADQVLMVKTRGSATVGPAKRIMLAKCGVKIKDGRISVRTFSNDQIDDEDNLEDPNADEKKTQADRDLFVALYHRREPGMKLHETRLIPLADQWHNDADLVEQTADRDPPLEWDFRRKLVNVRDRNGVICADTEPWETIEEFKTNRSRFDKWRKAGNVLKTADDFHRFMAWDGELNGRKSDAGRRSSFTIFQRNLAVGLAKGLIEGAPNHTHQQIADLYGAKRETIKKLCQRHAFNPDGLKGELTASDTAILHNISWAEIRTTTGSSYFSVYTDNYKPLK